MEDDRKEIRKEWEDGEANVEGMREDLERENNVKICMYGCMNKKLRGRRGMGIYDALITHRGLPHS